MNCGQMCIVSAIIERPYLALLLPLKVLQSGRTESKSF